MLAPPMDQLLNEIQKEDVHCSEEHDLTELRERIRAELLAHLALIGLSSACPQKEYLDVKEQIRLHHAAQRSAFRENEQPFLLRYGRSLLQHFAEGQEIDPEAVDPYISLVTTCTEDADLFRLATLLWSVPVSRGYGRRLRFLVRDRANGRLLGLFALADPVFNLKARDAWIGWNSDDRRQRLVHVMDAHIVGAVPPYSFLLGGKIAAALMASQEVSDAFATKYSQKKGIISQQYKHAQLLLITVSSALGRSSLYNRLKLPGIVDFI
ncbi:MAG: Druantia anti-phage system protein DruA, partial [Ktedonobacteraceae bacterium]